MLSGPMVDVCVLAGTLLTKEGVTVTGTGSVESYSSGEMVADDANVSLVRRSKAKDKPRTK